MAGEGECYVALRSVRGLVLLVLLRHSGDGGCSDSGGLAKDEQLMADH